MVHGLQLLTSLCCLLQLSFKHLTHACKSIQLCKSKLHPANHDDEIIYTKWREILVNQFHLDDTMKTLI